MDLPRTPLRMSNPAIPHTIHFAGRAVACVVACLLSLLAGEASLWAQPRGSANPRFAQASSGPVLPRVAARLSAPLRTSIEGRPVRELLTQLAELAEVNLWIDRRLDPDRLVSLDREPRTLFGAIAAIAEAAGAEAVVVNDLVLVGPPETVHSLLGLLLSARDPTPLDSPPITLGWPEASTPEEALRHVGGDSAVGESFPHDLWPAVRWQGISVPLATLLVTAQFDRMPADWQVAGSSATRPGEVIGGRTKPRRPAAVATIEEPAVAAVDAPEAANLPADFAPLDDPSEDAESDRPSQPFRWSPRLVPLNSPASLVVSHPSGPHANDLRRAVTAADPKAWVKPSPASRRLEVGGSPAAQAAAIRQTLTRLAPQAAGKVDLDKVRFTLNLRGIPAGSVFAQLAMTADHVLMIEADAQTACQTLVMLDANDRTLRELAKLVADQVGVRAEWSDGQLRISRR